SQAEARDRQAQDRARASGPPATRLGGRSRARAAGPASPSDGHGHAPERRYAARVLRFRSPAGAPAAAREIRHERARVRAGHPLRTLGVAAATACAAALALAGCGGGESKQTAPKPVSGDLIVAAA